MAKQRYTAAEVCEACEGTGGIKIKVANKLGCSRMTVDRYIQRYPTVREALRQADETLTDEAEDQSGQLIRERYWPAIRYRLSTKGKDRGYVERTEQEIRGDPDAPIRMEYVNNWRPDHSPVPAPGPTGGDDASAPVQLAECGQAVEEDDAGNGDSGCHRDSQYS